MQAVTTKLAVCSFTQSLRNLIQLADSYKSFAFGVYAIIFPPLYRTIGHEPDVRDDGTHTNVNETIDVSVF